LAQSPIGQPIGPRLVGLAPLVLLVVLAIAVGAGLWWAVPRAPEADDWNRLAKTLVADEFGGDVQWNPVLMSKSRADPTPTQVAARLQSTVDALYPHMFGRNWNGVPPGRVGKLRKAAQAYAAAYTVAHASPKITSAFDGHSLAVAEGLNSPSDAPGLLAQLGALDRALRKASAPWETVKADAGKAPDVQRLRTLLGSRQRLVASDEILLRFIIDHPTAAFATAADGSVQVQSPDATAATQGEALLAARVQAAADLSRIETAAQGK
jgi:hypothetical protein